MVQGATLILAKQKLPKGLFCPGELSRQSNRFELPCSAKLSNKRSAGLYLLCLLFFCSNFRFSESLSKRPVTLAKLEFGVPVIETSFRQSSFARVTSTGILTFAKRKFERTCGCFCSQNRRFCVQKKAKRKRKLSKQPKARL